MITIIVIQQAFLAPKWRKDGPDVYWRVNGKLHHTDPIHKWPLFYFCSVIVQISLPSLTLEQEFLSI